VATAVFARLQAEPAFQADLKAAREELAALPAKPAGDCAAEAAALAGG
jgi:acid phosphatase (class A)